ncbi:MAG: leucine-rich repeat domain-containing protein [Bacteroidaceae bacterium]|nr:leucine-rich repeat domain-containing protein [Bacteroidaceae bacterium]
MGKLFMKSLFYLCVSCMAILMPFGLTSCAADDELAEHKEYDGGGIKSFTSFTATLDEVAGTRAYLDAEATNGIRRVHWNLSDVIYVYSDTDPELKKYEMTSLSEDDQAVFTGEEVTGNKFYAVYARNREITIDDDNYNILHFSRAGMTSTYGFHGPLVAITTGNTLSFKQVIGIIHVTVGNINTIDRVSFRGNNNERIGGKGYVDMSESHPILRLDEDASTISYSQIFNDSFDDKYTDIYICIPTTVFEDGFSVCITGKDSNDKEFTIDKTFNSRLEVKVGTISRFSLVDVSAELEAQGSDEIIVFADPEVKQICVENWDTNGDGELSYKEAAAVTEIGQIFLRNADIKSFDEFQYFTGVTSIGYGAFRGCSSLTSMIIPEGVTSIGNSAFLDCSSLNSIVIPEGVASIGSEVFSDCSSLTSIVIPESVTSIDNSAFLYCSSLTSIVVDKNNNYYDSRNDCNAIIETKSNTLVIGFASTVIPSSVTSIGDEAFQLCSSLTSIEIPEGVTSIGSYAFDNCNNLTSIVIHKRVTSIGNSAFRNCCSLTSIVIPEGVAFIDDKVFWGCNNLTNIVIPESVTSIGYAAFSGCSGLTSIVIPEGVTSIGSYAFDDCYNLTSIVIPEGVTSIEMGVFMGCSSLASIVIPEGVTSIGSGAFSRCSSLASIVIPEGVTSIDNSVFSGCSSLISIVIPGGVISIGSGAFYGFSSLTRITCLAVNPPTYDNVFLENFGNSYSGTIYVPAASVEAYKAADGWKDYASQIQAIQE